MCVVKTKVSDKVNFSDYVRNFERITNVRIIAHQDFKYEAMSFCIENSIYYYK